MKDDFLWGSATAAYQCEGAWNVGKKSESVWDIFNHGNNPLNINHTDGDESCDFYHRYEEDIKMLKAGGQNTFRLSIASTRIYPKLGGEIFQDGIDFYNDVINCCLRNGVVPFVTLFHYDLPNEIAENGGWLNRETIDWFVEYSKICFEAFGDRVKIWSTINEPRYYSYCGFIAGNYPPNQKCDFDNYWRHLYNLGLATAKTVIAYKEMKQTGQIGFDDDSGFVQVAPGTKDEERVFKCADLFIDRFIADLAIKGKLPDYALDLLEESNMDISWYNEADCVLFENGKVDFVGQHVYCRAYVTDFSGGETEILKNNSGKNSKVKEGMRIKGWFETAFDPNVKRNHWGREVRPESVYDIIMNVKNLYGDIPIYITESGHGDYDVLDELGQCNDQARIDALDGFIENVLKAKAAGANVKGYYVWSTMDLYSWINGYEKRYGLVYVDYEKNLERVPKKSYYWYKNRIEKYEKGGIRK